MIAIAVTSGKGGVGKSTVSLNLALALAERGSSVGPPRTAAGWSRSSLRPPKERSLWAAGVVRLGSLPLDPAIARAGDEGRPVFLSLPTGVVATAYRALAGEVADALEAA